MIKPFYLLFIFFFLAIRCGNDVATVRPAEETISESVYASGIIKAENQYQAFASANATVATLLVKEGDTVKKGEVILRLDNTTARLNVESAGLLAENASATKNREKLRDLQNAIQLAKTKMEFDSSLLERQLDLWKNKIGSRNEVDQLALAYKNSGNAYKSALLNYAELQKEIRYQDRQAQTNLNISKSLAANYDVISEVDGKVYKLLVLKGEMVSMQTPVAIIGSASDFMLELQVDEYDIARIKTGQRVLINMDSYKGEVFEARVTRINPLMNERSNSFTIEAKFINLPPALFPNLSCEANIIIRSKDKALTIPRNYLLEGNYVLMENNEKRKVVTGLMDYQKVEIVEGLTTKDVIRKPEE